VLAAEHLAGLRLLDIRLEVVEAFDEVAVDSFARFRPLDEHAHIVGASLQCLAGRQLFFEAAAPLKEFLRLAGVLPEFRVRDAALDLVELRAMARFVKDSSADRRPV